MDYQARTDDILHTLLHVLQAPQRLQAMPAHAGCDADLLCQVTEEAARFVDQQIAPLQRVGDEVGCRWEDGRVTAPPGFRAAYQAYWQAGWPALACAPQDGGQGLPAVLEAVLYEMLCGANHGWTMAPGLLHGAYECIRHHADAPLRGAYLAKVASGEWLATMCLTEAHAGSDLGQVRTRATAQTDGSYRIEGTKIFISGGEHDMSDNIVHLVLARIPGAPAGPKGLSLFLAPKYLPDGARNQLACERIEHKMGLHGSPTCVMRFEAATGWLVGEAGRGLNAMFVMMNAARLHVALQGVGLLEAAWQKADAYARERRQMRAPQRPAGTTAAADLIAEHPAMRRILDTQRAWVDGGRVLAYHTAIELDVANAHPDAARRAEAQSWCALVTPVLKAACTHQAFHGASDCLQVFGGHGYVREGGIEQIVRDSRVAMIYEGTNEIQAIDLLVRKVLPDGGAALHRLLDGLRADTALPGHAALAQRVGELQALTDAIVRASRVDSLPAYRVADDFLRAVALVLMQWAWAKIDAARAPDGAAPRWAAPSAALRHWILPEFAMRCGIIAQLLAEQPDTLSANHVR